MFLMCCDCRYSQDDVEGSLKVMGVQMKDSGVYSCEIITEWDSVKAIGFITVQGKAVHTHAAAKKCCSISSQPYQCLWFSTDKPDAPASVVMSEKKQRSVTLSWMAGNENNSPVSGKQKSSPCHLLLQYLCMCV